MLIVEEGRGGSLVGGRVGRLMFVLAAAVVVVLVGMWLLGLGSRKRRMEQRPRSGVEFEMGIERRRVERFVVQLCL